ncbi:hypothetical protein DID75_04485 [Candidatus Marinamargulisbacteria bacterium SCGC AG-410-N11]|nr:hypothetical protein DID75_04485 [Candidatus Marinamargulisbacteria bacterium SCGC AG-410-N11]
MICRYTYLFLLFVSICFYGCNSKLSTSTNSTPAPETIRPRIVLLEKFTATWCGPCVTSADKLHQIFSSNNSLSDNVILIRYGIWDDYYTKSLGSSLSTRLDERSRYYNVTGIPSLAKDGQVVSAFPNSKDDLYPTSLGEPLYKIELTQDGSSITAKITAYETITSSSHKIRAVLIEPDHKVSTPPGSNGQTQFEGIVLSMHSDVSLTALSKDEVFTKTYDNVKMDYTFPNHKPSTFKFIVFIQDDTNKHVLQAAFITL